MSDQGDDGQVEQPKMSYNVVPALAIWRPDDEPFSVFIARFDAVVKANKWDKEQAAAVFATRLPGTAFIAYVEQADDVKSDYEKLKEALEKVLAPPEERQLHRALFRTRVRKTGESLDVYAFSLKDLCRKAYPKLSVEMIEEISGDKFIEGLGDLSAAVGRLNPLTLTAALAVAKRIEASRQVETEVKAAVVEAVNTRTVTRTPQQSRNIECFKCGKQGHRARECRKDITCYSCGKTGHYKSQCRNNKREGSQFHTTTPAQSHSTTPPTLQGQQGCSAVQGKSTLVEVSVNDHKIQALVDTGSTISLINPNILSTIAKDVNRKPCSRSANTAGGGQLLLSQEVELNIKIGQKHYKQSFYVAGITSDMILGVDFLKENSVVIDLPNNSLRLGENQSNLLFSYGVESIESVYKLCLFEATEIPPNSEVILNTHLNSVPKEKKESCVAMCEPISESADAPEYLVAHALVNINSEGIVPVRVANMNSEAILLEKGQIVAQVTSVDTSFDTNSVSQSKDNVNSTAWIDTFDLSHLTEEQAAQVRDVIMNYEHIFSQSQLDLGKASGVKHHIDTGSAAPVKSRSYRYSPAEREIIEREVDKMQEAGIVEPSTSPWSAPVVLCKKKDGSPRLCIDYRRLNAVTVKDAHPLPVLEEVLQSLQGAKYFSTLDLRSGFYQVPLGDEDKEKTAFTTGQRLMQFNVLPMGLCNSPAVFQRLMVMVLAPVIGVECYAYIDDIISWGSSFEEALDRLTRILKQLELHNLKIHPDKCTFLQTEVKWLGHHISHEGIRPSEDKVKSILEFPTPQTKKEVRAYLGLINYYRRFAPGLAQRAQPLWDLANSSDTKFTWTNSHEVSFSKTKKLLTSPPLLALPDFKQPFIIDSDASATGVGAVLSQVDSDGMERVVEYASRALTKAEQRYGITDREALAMVFAATKFRPYIYGQHVTFRVDHNPLAQLKKMPDPTHRRARWLDRLETLDYEIIYRPGKQHLNADALSRAFNGNSVSAIQIGSKDEVKECQSKDPDLKEIAERKVSGITLNKDDVNSRSPWFQGMWQQMPHLQVIDGVLYRVVGETTQVVIPQNLQRKIMQWNHDDQGHLGINKVYGRIQQKYYWPRMHDDIVKYCQQCQTCARVKRPAKTARAPLQPIDTSTLEPFEMIATDITGPLPETVQGNKYILVVIDFKTRYVQAIPMPNQKAETVAKTLLENWMLLYGVPAIILTDQGRNYESKLMHEVCDLLGIDKRRTTAYHPECNGLCERQMSTFKTMLTTQCESNQRNWDMFIAADAFALNTSTQASTKEIPYELAFGRAARSIDLVRLGLRTTPFARNNRAELLTQLSNRLDSADKNLHKAQARQKKNYDKRINPTVYLKGDWVYLKSVPKSCSKKGVTKKLSAKWTGPYEVTDVRGVNLAIRRPSGPTWVHHNRVKLAFSEEPDPQPPDSPEPAVQNQQRASPTEADESSDDNETEDSPEESEDSDTEDSEEESEGSEDEDGHEEEAELPQQDPTTTRSGRIVQPPQYLKDYVTDF